MANIIALWMVAACALLFGACAWGGARWYAAQANTQRGDMRCDVAGILGAVIGTLLGVIAALLIF